MKFKSNVVSLVCLALAIVFGLALTVGGALAQGKKPARGKAKRPEQAQSTPGAGLQPKAVFPKFAEWAECVAFAPDGKTLAVGSYGTVKLLDIAEKHEIAALPQRAGFVKSLAFSVDGKLLAAGGYQSLELWDVNEKKVVRKLGGHRGYVTSVAFSSDEKILASAADDETVKLWNVATGELRTTLTGIGLPALAVAISPDGRLIAVGTGDADRPTKKGVVRLFDAEGNQRAVLDGHTRIVSAVAFSPDGRMLATGSADESIKLWEVDTGRELRVLEGHSRPVNSLAFIGGGKWLASVCGGRAVGGNELKLWDVSNGKDLATVEAHEGRINQLALSVDEKLLATASVDKSVKIWDVKTILAAAGVGGAASPGKAASDDSEFQPEPPALPEPATAVRLAAALALAPDDKPADKKKDETPKEIRIGIIGLDTSHSVAFTQILNTPSEKDRDAVTGCRVVAAYPKGSPDIPSSVERVPEYTIKVKDLGVEIVDTIEDLVTKVDAVLLETNDGRPHLNQVLPVLKAGKPVFIDKPIAGSLADAVAIFEAARKHKVPLFSSSSLRYTTGAQAIRGGKIGEVKGCDAYSPCSLEATHPDLFWYGIHGVESLFTVMGTGCEKVTRVSTPALDVVVGEWKGGRVGTFRGIRTPEGGGQAGYGGTAFGTKGVEQIGTYGGYQPLMYEIVKFFRTGKPPVTEEETLEIYAFMEAADESKRQGGKPVTVESVLAKAREAAKQRAEK
ncbi:MAG: Gfo/Idh/MocA family oxidoreductase [Planctomycetia bacterium]|nr:Gfo/Idh/MocA family oxidoreductase [Planctomycetia bacterium]